MILEIPLYVKKTPQFFTENMYCLVDQADGIDKIYFDKQSV